MNPEQDINEDCNEFITELNKCIQKCLRKIRIKDNYNTNLTKLLNERKILKDKNDPASIE